MAASIVAALFLGAAAGWLLRRDAAPAVAANDTPAPWIAPVAFLASDSGCNWGADSAKFNGVGSTVQLGDEITLYEGIAEFRLSSGVSVSVEGPSAFFITSPTSIVAQHGKLTVYVPAHVKNFRMLASSCRVTARGAEFGIDLAGSRIDIHAFLGQVFVSRSPFHDPIDDSPLSAEGVAVARGEADLASGTKLAKAVIENRRALSLVSEGDDVRVAGWSAARSGEFSTKLPMGGDLPITDKYVEGVLAAGPVGYWRFEELRDSKARNEIKGGIELNVVDNVRLSGGMQNRALDFSQMETSSYLISEEPLESLAGGDYSVEFWMKPSHFHRGGIIGLMKDPRIERGQHALLLETKEPLPGLEYRYPKRLRFLHRDPPSNDFETGTSCYSGSQYRVRRWQHVVAVKKTKEAQMRLYMNGKLAATAKESSSLASDLYLVLRWTPGVKDDRHFFGFLDELAVYDRALTKDEVEIHYNLIRWSPKTPEAAEVRSRPATKLERHSI
jgi:hypothetical protein